MNGKSPAFKESICPWIPFIFSVVLSGIVMLLWIITGNIETAYPAFFCFLPMSFFFHRRSGEPSPEATQANV
jgi:hypothetical protein